MADGNDRLDIGLTTTIEEIVEAHPEVLEIALKSTVQELAEYSAIRRAEELRDAISSRLRHGSAGDEAAAHR